jgi:hypothetical protein
MLTMHVVQLAVPFAASPPPATQRPQLRGSGMPRLRWRWNDAQVGQHLGAKLCHYILAQLRFGACVNAGCAEALADRETRIIAEGGHDADGRRRRVTPQRGIAQQAERCAVRRPPRLDLLDQLFGGMEYGGSIGIAGPGGIEECYRPTWA